MHSDSWGSSNKGVYDSLAVGIDAFTWSHQDFLPVFAAGNFGARGTDSSVASPATAKNCLSVGQLLALHTSHVGATLQHIALIALYANDCQEDGRIWAVTALCST